MKSFTINKNDADQRLDKFITKSVPLLPKTLLYKYIRIKRIKVNGKRAEISTRLNVGDVVDMYINDEFFDKAPEKYDFLKASKNLNIIYEDENIILCDKKVGVLSHPDDNEYIDTLIGRIKRYLYEKEEYKPDDENSFVPSLVNRIDRNTGGIVIAAKNAETLRILNQKMKDRELHKFYLCIVHGEIKKKSGLLEGYLVKDESKCLFNVIVDISEEKYMTVLSPYFDTLSEDDAREFSEILGSNFKSEVIAMPCTENCQFKGIPYRCSCFIVHFAVFHFKSPFICIYFLSTLLSVLYSSLFLE